MNISISPENKENMNMLQKRIVDIDNFEFMLDYRKMTRSAGRAKISSPTFIRTFYPPLEWDRVFYILLKYA